MRTILDRTTLVTLGLATLVGLASACGGKKKQETIPADTSGGTTAAPAATTATDTAAPTEAQAPNLQDVIYFAFDQADLDEDAKRKLQENASWLKADPARTLTIEGHTDEVGTAEYNLALGERRARASREYLVALGADPSKVSVITYGEERPAGGDDAQNRRSMFIATKK